MYNPLLTAFVTVADSGSFNKAAEKLYLSPPSVMKQINALEKHLGLVLVERTHQGVRLTEAGRIIYRHAQILFDYSEKAIAEAREQAEDVAKMFCIGSSLLNPCKPFMDLWYQVNDAFPGYSLHIVPFEDDHAGILGEIGALGEKYDFLVGPCDSLEWLTLCDFYPLGTYQHCLAVSRDHPLAQKKQLRIEDLYGQTVMMIKGGDSASVDAIRHTLEKHPAITIEDTAQHYDISVFNRCAQTGNVMLTIECWKDVNPALVAIPVDWDFPIPYGLMVDKNAPEDVRRFLALVENL